MPSLLPLPTPARLPRASRAPQVEIVVPGLQRGARAGAQAIRRLQRVHCAAELPLRRPDLVIADNASTDATPAIAERLART